MKFFKFFLGFALFSSVKSQAGYEKFEVMINQTIEECRVIENATLEDAAILYSEDDVWPVQKEGKCLIECVFQEMGIVRTLKRKV